MDRASTWSVAAEAAAGNARNAIAAIKPESDFCCDEAIGADRDRGAARKKTVEQRSILVRDLPRQLGTQEATDALRKLFSAPAVGSGLALGYAEESQGRRAREAPPPVAARRGALPQSSWRNNRLFGGEDTRATAPQASASVAQHKQLLQQLPYAVSNISVASDQLGGSAYAIVDFTHEIHANLALQLLGHSAILPESLSHVRLSLHETWTTPLAVDQYHVYVAGLPPGATPTHFEVLVKTITGTAPSHVKMSSVAGTPSRKGMREYGFIRFSDDDAVDDALKRLEGASASLHLIVRKVHEHRCRGSPSEPLTHAANCSIFIANLPPLTNSEELREICSYFHLVRAVEIHPTRNFGFIRLASHEAALAAISHLHGMQLHGRTLACAWSSRCVELNEEEPHDAAWEQAEEAYAVMSAQCMDFEEEPVARRPAPRKQQGKPMLNRKSAAKQGAAQAAGEAFWLSFLAENGPVAISDICCQLKRRQEQKHYLQARLQQWHEQEWEEDVHDMPPEETGSESVEK